MTAHKMPENPLKRLILYPNKKWLNDSFDKHVWVMHFKNELGELQIYFRKIPLQQQIWKNVQNETTKLLKKWNY